ncbi:MAG: hypothetical protein KBF37_11725 [Saprospiraceae bacterium]|jgi:mevalonate kinase|nr:hypothetical protein [Saprospiraceae bacterium]MBP9210976.1 hypothetical protein [Saprospiraceae bacterium]MBV6474429.1 hypothetical protein [Saprospiraceae bacterium]
MVAPRSYPAKMLLAGEYAVLLGSPGLAIPLPSYALRWARSNDQVPDPRLFEFAQALATDSPSRELLDLDAFNAALHEGWFLSGNIPLAYGMGSSGAVCAAVYDRFGTMKSTDPPVIRDHLRRMEAHFHGSSSGLDPLVSYLAKPVRIDGSSLEILEFPLQKDLYPMGVRMIDSGIPRSTRPLVTWFERQLQSPVYSDKIQTFVSINRKLIDALTTGNVHALFNTWESVSTLSLEIFPAMIPESILSSWRSGLQNRSYFLKLCGAGGGGLFLVLVKDEDAFKKENGQWIKGNVG